MGPMPTATTQRHPPDQLIHAIRAALLSTIKAECPEVLDDLRDSVFTPLSLWMTRDDIVALLRRYSPRVHDPRLGSAHHQVRALIVCWARRWHLTAPLDNAPKRGARYACGLGGLGTHAQPDARSAGHRSWTWIRQRVWRVW